MTEAEVKMSTSQRAFLSFSNKFFSLGNGVVCSVSYIFSFMERFWKKNRAKQNTRGNRFANYCKLSESGEQKRTSWEAEDYTPGQEKVTADSRTAASGVPVKLCLLDVAGKQAPLHLWITRTTEPGAISPRPVVFLLIYSKLSGTAIGSELWGGSHALPFASPSHRSRRLESKCSSSHGKGTSSKKRIFIYTQILTFIKLNAFAAN